MCTIIIVNHHLKEFPLIIASNRDEDYNRSFSPVQILAKEPHLIIGGKDNLKGGTWLGVNKQSLFVSITNQKTNKDDPNKTSRGSIVMDALKCKTLDELLTFVEELDPSKYNGFNLVFGNNQAMYVAHSYLLHSIVIRELPPGISVISSNMKFAGLDEKVQYIHKSLDTIIDQPWLVYYKKLKKVLASSDYGVKLKARKREGKISGYCTQSSSILSFSNDGLARYKFYDRITSRSIRKEGDPFIPQYRDYIDLWRDPDTFKFSDPISHEENENEEADENKTQMVKNKLQDTFNPTIKLISPWKYKGYEEYDPYDD